MGTFKTSFVEEIAKSIKDVSFADIEYAVDYLEEFSYLNLKLDGPGQFGDRLMNFQKTFDLPITGELDEQTILMMNVPRCSVPDFVVENATQYTWRKKDLLYYTKSRVRNINANDFDQVIDDVMNDAMANCGIRIRRTNSSRNADLVLDSGSSTREELGRRGGVLAWAQLPVGNNRQLLMKFDLAENWTINYNAGGIYLPAVAAHEIAGHMLGLPHTNDKRALLYPMYQRQVNKLQPYYDIPQLQARYGKPVVSRPDPKPTPSPEPTPTPTPVPTPKPGPSSETVIKLTGNIQDISIDGYRVSKIT